jgi:hypothetical protein
MKKTLIKLAVVAAASVALMQTVQATPITGNIGFSGSAVLNTGSISTASKVTTWLPTVVNSDSGTFTTGASPAIVLNTTTVTLAAPWTFNSGALPSFWTVAGFTFNLLSSTALPLSFDPSGNAYLSVYLVGTVTGNGFDATAFTGSFQVSDPSANGLTTFTTRLSFNSVPDGGTTVILLGAALSGLALIKRKLVA